MASPVNNQANREETLPRILFRWCRAVLCQAKDVHLHLTSLSGSDIPLEWNSHCGWYESGLVPLPLGLHTGFIRVCEKVHCSILVSDSEPLNSFREQDYKIDPFFVTPHEFGVELFVQSDENQIPITDSYPTGRTPLRFDLLAPSSCGIEILGGNSLYRKCVSCEDFNRSSQADPRVIRNFKSKGCEIDCNLFQDSLKSIVSSQFPGSGKRLNGQASDTFSFSRDKIKKSLSLDCEEGSLLFKGIADSSYFSKRKSFDFENCPDGEFSVEHSRKSQSCCDWKSPLCENYSPNSKNVSSSLKNPFTIDINELLTDVCARTQSIEELLRESDEETEEAEKGVDEFSSRSHKKHFYFKEVDPPKNENFGCLITFESRSTSMNDVGSPAALEDVIVSLASTENSIPANQTSSLSKNNLCKSNSHNQNLSCRTDDKKLNIGWNSTQEKFSSLSKSSTQDSSQKSVDIYEDENFKFDSLKADDRNFALDIKSILSSEDSCNIFDKNHLNSEEKDLLPNLLSTNIAANSSERFDEICNDFLNSSTPDHKSSVSPRISDLSVDVSDSSFFVNPGSLQSVNGTSRTLVGSSESSFGSLQEKTKEVSPIEYGKTANETQYSILNGAEKTNVNDLKHSVVNHLSENRNREVVSTGGRTLTRSKNIDKTHEMNSTGTQTLPHDSKLPEKRPHSLTSSFSSSEKENSFFSPLPDKIKIPWVSSYVTGVKKVPEYPYSPHTKLKYLQKYLHNIDKADRILKDIHPFDYRPTILHNKSSLDNILNRPSKSIKRSHSSLLKRNIKNSTPVISSFNSYSEFFRSHGKDIKKCVDSKDVFRVATKLKKLSPSSPDVYGRMESTDVRKTHSTVRFSSQYSSTEEDYDCPRPLRSTTSMPNLQESYDMGYYTLPSDIGRSNLSRDLQRSTDDRVDLHRNRPRSSGERRSVLSRKRNSLGNANQASEDQGDNTDALIEEAADFATRLKRLSFYTYSENGAVSSPPRRVEYTRRRSSPGPLRYHSPNLPQSTLRRQSDKVSLTSTLRSRSETDLRRVGFLAGGHYGQPPYLPYSKEELTLGQVVKVLVPGEGVAMAKVVYNPSDFQTIRGQSADSHRNISVLLLSEPSNYCGSVINIPLDKVLLAWPKT